MKKRYLLSLIAGISMMFNTANAQTNLTQAVDFTVTDVNGIVYNLFNILNNGQHVCIDFFFDTCGPCQATSPYFKQTYNNFGCNNEDIFFIAVDLGDTDAQVVAYENTFLGGAPGYPSISGLDGGGNAVVTAYGISAFPTYILIRPDQMIIEQDMWPIADASTFTGFFATHGLNPVACSPLSINDDMAFGSLSVYPNPANDIINIKSDNQADEFHVLNLLGETVLSGAVSGQQGVNTQLDVTSLESGVYVLELVSEKGAGRTRFAKQ
jgi:thiol-disulfide isomerase/thioredoxin